MNTKLCIVKVQTEAFKRGDSYFYGKSIRVMKRLTEFDILADEIGSVGLKDTLSRILNLDKCLDGVYQVLLCNISKDIETGYLDYCDLKLIPYKGENK